MLGPEQVTPSGAITFRNTGKKRASVEEALQHRFMAQVSSHTWTRCTLCSNAMC